MYKISQGNVEITLQVKAGKQKSLDAAREHLGKECLYMSSEGDTVGVITDIQSAYGGINAIITKKEDIKRKNRQTSRQPFENLRLIPETKADFELLREALGETKESITMFIQCSEELGRDKVTPLEFEIWKTFKDFGTNNQDKNELYAKIRTFIKEIGAS